MLRHAVQRLMLAVPVMFGVLLVGFLLMQVVPTDPAIVRAFYLAIAPDLFGPTCEYILKKGYYRRDARVVTLPDRETLHNAFPDRSFRPPLPESP
jgi:hypothetical protein